MNDVSTLCDVFIPNVNKVLIDISKTIIDDHFR